MGDDIPCPSSLRHYWSYFESIQGTASTLHFSDYQGQAHKIVCSIQQGDAFETVRFAVTTFPSFGRVFARHAACTGAAICDDVFIVAPLAESPALVAEIKQVLKQDLDLDLHVPKFNCFVPGDRINDDEHARTLFQNALLANPQLACLSGMDAGISTTGLRVAGVFIGIDEWVQQFVQAKAAAVKVDVVSSTLYLTVSFTIRCYAPAKTLVLLFLVAILEVLPKNGVTPKLPSEVAQCL